MATLLDGVNAVLKRVREIDSSGELSSLTDSARQVAIDIAVMVWNEAIEDLYQLSSTPYPQEQAESTITLATGDRSYALASGLLQMRWPLIDKTNNQFIWEYEHGYNGLLLLDPEQDDTGLPLWSAINPVNGELHLDRAPTSVENNNVYTYQYDKDVSLSLAADTMPFNDAVYRALVPAVAELWRRDAEKKFDGPLFKVSRARAAGYLTQTQPAADYAN